RLAERWTTSVPAGRVDERVDPAVPLDDVGDHQLDRRRVAQVDGDKLDAGRRRGARAPHRPDHPRAPAGQGDRDRTAERAAAPPPAAPPPRAPHTHPPAHATSPPGFRLPGPPLGPPPPCASSP